MIPAQRRRKYEEVHSDADGNRDNGKDYEVQPNNRREAAAPFDGIADTFESAKQNEGCDAGAERHQNCKHVR